MIGANIQKKSNCPSFFEYVNNFLTRRRIFRNYLKKDFTTIKIAENTTHGALFEGFCRFFYAN